MANQPPSEHQPPRPGPASSLGARPNSASRKTDDAATPSPTKPRKNLETVRLPNSTRRSANDEGQVRVAAGQQQRSPIYRDENGLPVFNFGKMVSRFDQDQIATETGEEQDRSFAEVITRNRQSLSSFLVSLIFHTSLLIMLALVILVWPAEDTSIGLVANIESTPTPERGQFDLNAIEISPTESDQQSPLEQIMEQAARDEAFLIPETDQLQFQNESEADPVTNRDAAPTATVTRSLPTGGGLEGRRAELRASRAAARGATEASEQAVELGLAWIVAHQFPDGSWRLMHDRGECGGQCRNPGTQESTTAATGLALMAILGAGYTHQSGPYQEQVKAGLDYLLKRMRVTRFGGNLSEGSMYAQGIATLALSEAYIMTRDEYLRDAVEKAMQYIVAGQHSEGGWRYNPRQPGDMTVTGWQVMALKSCQMGGVHPPGDILNRAEFFIRSLSNDGYQFGYQKKTDSTPATDAIGLLMLLYLGEDRERGAMFSGAENLISTGPSRTDIYYNYYATLALHHLNSQHFELWNTQMRDYLVRTQDSRGHQRGSWYFPDQHGKVGGRLYTTAMAVMILEVYYRYLPLYEEKTVLEKFAR